MFIYYGLAAAAAPSAAQEMVANECRNAFASIWEFTAHVVFRRADCVDRLQCDVMESHQVAA